VTYFRVETTAGWTHLDAKNLREAKNEALVLRARSLATTGSRYCLLTKHKDDSKPGFVGTQIGEWKMSNITASGWTAVYISAVTSRGPRRASRKGQVRNAVDRWRPRVMHALTRTSPDTR
jgi:hypothetical protein